MPHFIAEYSANLGSDVDFDALFEAVHQLLGDSGVFPLGGIRSRAIRMDHYRIADGKHDYAFIHFTLKVGSGRDISVRKKAADDLFELITAFFKSLQDKRLLAISFEMQELDSVLNYKKNNIHDYLKSHGT